MTLPVEISSRVSTPDLFIAKQPVNLLKVAIKHARTGIISRLLEQHPNLMSDDHSPLRRAIFSNNNQVLKALLEYTPHNLPDLLTDALSHYWTLLTQSNNGSETIR